MRIALRCCSPTRAPGLLERSSGHLSSEKTRSWCIVREPREGPVPPRSNAPRGIWEFFNPLHRSPAGVEQRAVLSAAEDTCTPLSSYSSPPSPRYMDSRALRSDQAYTRDLRHMMTEAAEVVEEDDDDQGRGDGNVDEEGTDWDGKRTTGSVPRRA
uniref:Uncharacterized protein n=1 Tax=Mycena chlorophos TaxID=658473 RepID=A0ABQ0KZ36_MYCCL|nr:predicted protein [Mycena chlorophos]